MFIQPEDLDIDAEGILRMMKELYAELKHVLDHCLAPTCMAD